MAAQKTMNGINFIKELGAESVKTNAELKELAKKTGKSFVLYSLSHNGESVIEGEGSLKRASMALLQVGEKPERHVQSFLVAATINLYPDTEIERAVKLLDSKSECNALETKMHQTTGWSKTKQFRGKKTLRGDRCMELAYKFAKHKNLSRQAADLLERHCYSNFETFVDIKTALKYGHASHFAVRELEDAFGFTFSGG